ncbi:hypothetical protein F183_A30030 [Bryobacterales bacterium F-183]|nr:hypothetical protein F183_A30030 [Bryobacterales bacterium F-183]
MRIESFARFAVVAGLVLQLMSCSKPKAISVRIDPALAALIPNDTKYLADIKLDKLKDSAVYDRYVKDQLSSRFDEFARNTGLDPRKDLWEILICSDGKRGVMMGRGKFAVADLEPRLEREGARRFRYKSYNFFGDEENAGAFINVSTALVGSTELLKQIVDRNNNPSIPPSLEGLIASVPAGTQMFAVFNGLPLEIPDVKDPNWSNLARVARSVESGWVGLNLSRGINASIVANCKSPDMAQGLQGAARGLLGFARLSTPSDQQDVLKAIDGVDIRIEQSTVKIAANVNEDVVEGLMSGELMRMFRSRR